MKLSGGEKFEAAIKDIAAKLSQPGTLRVGFLEGATYASGLTDKGVDWSGGLTVAQVAFWNEFGRMIKSKDKEGNDKVSYQPPRPFFRNMIAAKSGEWPGAIALNLKQQKYDTARTLNLAGEGIVGQLRQSIQDTNAPPLAPSTIARKGFDKPLIDTGHMWNSADYEVRV